MLTSAYVRRGPKVHNWRWARSGSLACGAWFCLAMASVVGADNIVASIDVRGNTRTRSEVVLDELLFHPGDQLTVALREESERNLRRLLYLGRATIRTESTAQGSLHVTVEVDDLYARAVSPLFSGELSEISFGAVAVDYNLFGHGQYARLTAFNDATSGRRLTAQYGNPRLRRSHLRLSTEMGWSEEGHRLGLSLSRPFHTLATARAYGLSVSSAAARTRLYGGGSLAALYENRVDAGSLWYVRSYGQVTKVRPGLQLAVSDRSFDALAPFTYTPDDRRRVLPGMMLTVWRPRYARRRYLMLLGPQEDFQTGSFVTLTAGLSSRALGSDRSYAFASLTVAPGIELRNDWLLLTAWRTRLRWRDGGYSNLVSSGSARLLGRLSSLPTTPTLAMRFRADGLWRPEDAGSQFLLGGDSGLRGHRPRRFDGTRRLTTGIELRPLFLQRPDWVLGGALFVDAGGAWNRQANLHAAAGAGLRLGLPRVYDTPVVRVDLARGLAGGLWQLSFGLGQYL